MRKSTQSRQWPVAVLSSALALCFVTAAQAQTAAPRSELRLVSETPMQTQAAPTRAAAPVTAAELNDIASDAYVYAYPLVLMEMTRRAATGVGSSADGKAPMNQFSHHTALPDATTADARWPSTDGVNSNLWFDVSRAPLLIEAPDAGDRYVSLTLFDMWTDVFASRGTRTAGPGPQRFLLVGPYWQGSVPQGVDVVRSPTSMGWLIARAQITGQNDLAGANQFQQGLKATPWLQSDVRPVAGDTAQGNVRPMRDGRMSNPRPMAESNRDARMRAGLTPGASSGAQGTTDNAQGVSPFAGALINTTPTYTYQPNVDPSLTPAQQVAQMDAATFFSVFADVARTNPPHANDNPILDRLRRVGIGGTFRPFSFPSLDPAVQQALTNAAPLASRRITDSAQRLTAPVNGWNTVTGGIGTYGTDYSRRAAIAALGLGASVPEDVIYPVTMVDADGELLDAREDYVLHFDKAQLPPVDGHWSLFLYNADRGFARNEANRYAILSTDNLTYNKDGSLDIYIQKRQPRGDKQANWLPSPSEGNFMLNMRLYSPKNIALDGLWAPPAVREN